MVVFSLHTTFGDLCCWDITFRQPVTAAKYIIKSSLYLQKFKDAGQAETDAWLCLCPAHFYSIGTTPKKYESCAG
jgi:hypothetical protein